MPNTTDNFDIPFLDGTELVRDYPQFSEDLADAVDAGLVAAGKLVAVKSAIFTGVQSQSLSNGGNTAITNLSITHSLSDSSNRLIISFFGLLGPQQERDSIGAAVFNGSNFLAIGDADADQTRVTNGGGRISTSTNDHPGAVPVSFSFVHSPQTTSAVTYVAHVFNVAGGNRTVFVNRSTTEIPGSSSAPRGVSSLVIQEVKV